MVTTLVCLIVQSHISAKAVSVDNIFTCFFCLLLFFFKCFLIYSVCHQALIPAHDTGGHTASLTVQNLFNTKWCKNIWRIMWSQSELISIVCTNCFGLLFTFNVSLEFQCTVCVFGGGTESHILHKPTLVKERSLHPHPLCKLSHLCH